MSSSELVIRLLLWSEGRNQHLWAQLSHSKVDACNRYFTGAIHAPFPQCRQQKECWMAYSAFTVVIF